MIGADALTAVVPAFVTFVCAPIDPQRSRLQYVVSFQQDEKRLHNIVVIWPNGSPSHDRWKGKVSPAGYEIVFRERYSSSTIILTRDVDRRNAGKMVHRTSVWGGHIIFNDEDLATCVVQSEGGPIEVAQ